ncbi:MAG: hypothetical protein JNK82_30535 [Myxococcaceae bacterium]|nr:hypothetical protein [Myxococcaceae bacterium]
MISLVGLALAHTFGAVLLALATREPLRLTLRRPSAALVALAVLHLCSLGPAGLVLLAALAAAALWARPAAPAPPAAPLPWLALAGLAAATLARPWVPTQWDELVWLGKARLGAAGFDAVVDASLDPAQHLIPAGYPTLWPAAVGWLSLGRDGLTTQTLAASLLVIVTAAAALEAWWPHVRSRPAGALPLAAAALGAPLVWVHLRSVYLDLPLGLLGLALLGTLLGAERRAPLTALAFAVVLAGFKDEGVVHALAASIGAIVVSQRPSRSLALAAPAGLAVAVALSWRALAASAGTPGADHALGAPLLAWLPQLARLVWLHATDVVTWGVFWPVALVALARPTAEREVRSLKWLVAGYAAALSAGLVFGSERMRAFAENGTLLDRLLVQAWPAAALALLLALAPAQGGAGTASMPSAQR